MSSQSNIETASLRAAVRSARWRMLSCALICGLALFATADAATAMDLPRHVVAPWARPWGSSLIGSTTVAPGPSAVAVNPATHTVYVASGNNANGPNVGGNTVSVIDARRCRAPAPSRCAGPWPTITVGDLPSAVAVDVATDTVYVTNVGDNTVSVIDGARCNAQVSSGCAGTPVSVPVGATPAGIGADAANHTIYVANFDDGTVSLIDSATCNGKALAGCSVAAPPTVTVGGNPGDVDVNPRTHSVYVTNLTGLSAFDDRTCNATRQSGCAAVGQAPVPPCDGDAFPCGPFSASVDPDNNTIYESGGTTTVWVFDGRRCNAASLDTCPTDAPAAVTPFPQPGFEATISVVADTALHTVYVSYQKDDALLVIDADRCNGRHLAACATLKPPEIHTGADPESVALDATTQTLYTANQVDNSVSVINASRCSALITKGCRPRAPEVAIPGVPASGSPGAPAVDPAVATVYVPGPSGVTLIDARRCNARISHGCSAPTHTVLSGTRPSLAAVDRHTHTAYVGNPGPGGTATISVFDDRTCNATDQTGCASTSTLRLPDGDPAAIAVNPATHTIYIATVTQGGGPNLISVFDAATCDAHTSSGCDQTPVTVPIADDGGSNGSAMDLDVNRSTNTVYATSVTLGGPFAGDTVYVIDGATCNTATRSGCSTVPATITLPPTPLGDANPMGIAVAEATNTIYTANIADGEGPGTVSVINGATCNAADTSGCGQMPPTAPAGFGTTSIAVDPTTDHAYTANIEDSSVTAINSHTCRGSKTDGCAQTETLPIVGDYPRAITVDPTVRTAYVADLEGVSVIPLRP